MATLYLKHVSPFIAFNWGIPPVSEDADVAAGALHWLARKLFIDIG